MPACICLSNAPGGVCDDPLEPLENYLSRFIGMLPLHFHAPVIKYNPALTFITASIALSAAQTLLKPDFAGSNKFCASCMYTTG